MSGNCFGGDGTFKQSLDNHLLIGFYIAFRVFAVAFTAGLLGLASVYINALVLQRVDVPPLLIVLLLGFSVSLLYYIGAGFFYYMDSNEDKRFHWMAGIDLALGACYAGLAGYLGNLGLAVPCSKKQFAPGHLNRYNMGPLNNDRSILGWAKSSYEHCNHARDLFVFSIIVSISLIISAICCQFKRHQKKGS